MSVDYRPPARPPMATSLHTINNDYVILDGYAAYVPYQVKIASGVTLEIGADSDLEIG